MAIERVGKKYRVRIGRAEKRVSRTFSHKADAVAFEADAKARVAAGRPILPKPKFKPEDFRAAPYTLRDGFKRYLDRAERKLRNSKSSSAVQRRAWRGFTVERSRMGTISQHHIADIPLSEITVADLLEYRDTREDEGRKESTIKNDFVSISKIFRLAIDEWEWPVKSNPTLGWSGKPKTGAGEIVRIPARLESKLLKAAKGNDEATLLVMFALDCATRRCEMVDLQHRDINLKSHTARVIGKGGEPREVPLSERVVQQLKRAPARGDGKIFARTPEYYSNLFASLLDEAGCDDERISLHSTRHESTKRLFELGFATNEVMAVTGHQSYEMVDRYSKLDGEGLAAEVNRRRAKR